MKKKILIGLIIILILALGGIVTYAVIHNENSKIAILEEKNFDEDDSIVENNSNNEIGDNYLEKEAESQETEENQTIAQVTEEKVQKIETNNKTETKVNKTQKNNTDNNSSKNVNGNNKSNTQRVENNAKTTTTTVNTNSNDTKSSHHEESKHVHSKVGTMGKWFASLDELVAEYNRECEKWEKLYASKKITKDEFEKNCPYRL